MRIKTGILILLLSAIPFWGESQAWSGLCANCSNSFPTGFSSLEKLYIGTGPGVIGGLSVRGICAFDGVKVDSLNEGLGFSGAYDAVWYDGKLIAGGNFSYAGVNQWSIPNTQRIAAWDSINGWQSVTPNGGADSKINCLEIYNNELYAGGSFVSMNGLSVSRIAKWNGTSWSGVGGGIHGGMEEVTCMAVYHNQLYVGGDFYFSGSNNLSTNCIARWNGTSWDSVGCGLNWYLMDMVVDTARDVLYVAGGFSGFNNTVALGVAQWNDTTWTTVGTGLDTLWGTQCLAMFNGELYAGGGNVTVTTQGDTINNIYKFDGVKWTSADGGANNTVMDMAVYNGNLYVGGYFSQVGNGIPASKIACYGNTCPTSVAVAENPPAISFKMFPNPNKEVLRIEADEPGQLFFRLVDLSGKVMAEKKFSGKFEYNTALLASGTYIVQVSLVGGQRLHSEKLVIE